MSAGTKFLRVCIEHGETNLVRRLDPNFLFEEEVGHFEFVKGHLEEYGALPSADICAEEGFSLPSLRRSSTPQYHFDQLKKRFAYTEVNDRHPQLVEALRDQDTDGIIGTLSEMLQEARRATGGLSYSTIAHKAEEVLTEYNEAKLSPGLRGVTSGWETLDAATYGFMGGDLIVVAGRPSMGKSWALLQMAYSAHESGKVVAFTSMEMGLLQITRRWMGIRTGLNPNFLRAGELGAYEEERLVEAIHAEEERDAVHLLAGDMDKNVAGIEDMIIEFDPDIVYVDAAYLLSPSGRRRGYISRWESISEVIRELKRLALKYDKPIVVSVQFNRNQKNNSTKEFDLGDIGGSDSIPQDASVVLGMRKGPPPHEKRQRIIETMKDREGDCPRFAVAFTFSPVRLHEVELIDPEDTNTDITEMQEYEDYTL